MREHRVMAAVDEAASHLDLEEGDGVAVSGDRKSLLQIGPDGRTVVGSTDIDLSGIADVTRVGRRAFGAGDRYLFRRAEECPKTDDCKTNSDCVINVENHYWQGRTIIYCHTCPVQGGQCMVA